MQYVIAFLEGIITFISPCHLPLLPVFISYFAGGDAERGTKRALIGALGFVLGFTIVYVILGAFAGALGSLLIRYQIWLNIITGAVVLLFGLNYLGAIKIGFLNKTHAGKAKEGRGFFSSVLLGIVFSIGWTPCVGVFLGSALLLASSQGTALQGTVMLLCYSLGLGLPFIISAVLIEKLKNALAWVKAHHKIIEIVAGVFLVIMGILMMTGLMSRFIAFLD